MASTAVVEIIDLTDGHSPIDDDTQKIPKPETYRADAVPEKSAAQTVHKRKNGEVSRARSHPLESRGVSVERGHVLSREGTESQLAQGTQGKDGEPTRKRQRRFKKKKDKVKDSSSSREDTQPNTPTLDHGKLFFIDTAPAPVPAGMVFDSNDGAKGAQSSAQASEVDRVPLLLLPAHVSVLDPGDGLPVQPVQSVDSDSDQESYIEYLDYDDRLAPDMARYFNAAADEQKQSRFVCKRCGAENEHRTGECPVLICLTCGARGEHSTRSCPISKTCFTCGMKGHINKDCPNRHSRGMVNNYDDCDRCGSGGHHTKECPTIWRLYEYVTDHEREAILRHRESKQPLPLGQGGEGYIASDEWCHNCGNSGHLGDDCRELPPPHDAPSAPSAFGFYNTHTGPFSDAAAAPMRARAPRDWENGGESFGDGWGAIAPLNVGKRARNRDRLRMEQRALELQERERDDPGDWFESARNRAPPRSARHDDRGARRRSRSRSHSRSPGASASAGAGASAGGRNAGKKKDAKIRIGRAWKSDDPPPHDHDHHHHHDHRKPSLLERVSKDYDDHDRHRGGGGGSERRERFRNRDRDREWVPDDRDRDARGGEGSRSRSRGGGGRGGSGGGGTDGAGLRIRGSAAGRTTRVDTSRHSDSGVREREGRSRREEEPRSGDRRREDNRSRDRKYDSRPSRDDDRGPSSRGPQYKGGYAH